MLTTANAAETNSLTCLTKHGGAKDKKFLVAHPMTDQRCLTSVLLLNVWTTGKVNPKCRIFSIKSVLYVNVIKAENQEEIFESFIQSDVIRSIYYFASLHVRPTARPAIHLQFNISANALETRAVHSLKCIV
jgi:hypothetical protein